MSTKRDYYEVLGVARGASSDEIKRSYRQLARQFHPDVNKDGDAESRFKEINEAYEVLSNSEKRAAYDRFGHAGTQGGFGGFGGGFGDFGSIFEDLFAGMGMGGQSRQAQRGPRRGSDLRVGITLTFQEAVFGVDREVEVTRLETVHPLRGQRRGAGHQSSALPAVQRRGRGPAPPAEHLRHHPDLLHLPALQRQRRGGDHPLRRLQRAQTGPGHPHHQRHHSAGRGRRHPDPAGRRGQPWASGGPAGNLYVVLTVQPHPFFQRRDNDIVMELPINIAQAALGAEIEVPTLDGSSMLSVPPGTQSGRVLRLKGKGVPHLRKSERRGDQLVSVKVVVPNQLTPKQKKLLEELGESLGTPKLGTDRGFFDKIADALGDAFNG